MQSLTTIQRLAAPVIARPVGLLSQCPPAFVGQLFNQVGGQRRHSAQFTPRLRSAPSLRRYYALRSSFRRAFLPLSSGLRLPLFSSICRTGKAFPFRLRVRHAAARPFPPASLLPCRATTRVLRC